MRVGEVARVFVHPKYGYGEKGNFSFPMVPPSAELVYEMELLAFENENNEVHPIRCHAWCCIMYCMMHTHVLLGT